MVEGGRLRQRLTLTVACAAQVMMVLDVLIVSVALPSIQHELHLSPAGLEWVVSAYALALAALIPFGGALGDHFGRKRVFMAGVVVFTLASAGCALSVSGGMLIGFRVVQGIGGAVMSSLTLSLISEAYPPEARAAPIGLWAAVSGLAVAGGSVLGGLLLGVFPWSSIFWVNVPIGVLTVVISAVAVAESREPVPRPFDSMGVALSTSGLLLLTFGFVDSADATWGSPVVGVCVGAGVAVLAAFWVWEQKAASPMVPPSLLRIPSFGRACAVYLLAYLAFSGFIYYVTLFFQNIEGWSPLRTGLSWLFFCIPYFLVAEMGKWVERRLPVASAVGWGCLIAAAGVFGMSRLTTATPFAWPAACYVLVGVGFALMVPAGSTAAMAEVPEGSSGIGSGLFNACRQIGTTMGLAILGSIGASVILADWHRQSGSFPPAERQSAVQAGGAVAGGQVHAVAASVGQLALDPAVSSFLSGFELALLLAGATLAAAGLVGFLGLRHLPSPAPRQRQPTDARTGRLTGVPGRRPTRDNQAVTCPSSAGANGGAGRHLPTWHADREPAPRAAPASYRTQAANELGEPTGKPMPADLKTHQATTSHGLYQCAPAQSSPDDVRAAIAAETVTVTGRRNRRGNAAHWSTRSQNPVAPPPPLRPAPPGLDPRHPRGSPG